MATSLITMLNRLPIYNRPKEPAIGLVIGNPVLIETTNPNLPTIPIPPKYDHFGNLISISTGAPVTTPPPLISSRNVMFGGNSGKQLPPLPPGVGPQSAASVRVPAQNQYAPSPSPSLKGTIPRKPAPGGSASTPQTEAHPANRSVSRGFNPWGDPQRNLVSVDNHGPQTGGRVAPPVMPPSPPHHYNNSMPKLVKHQSIDDWTHKRENAPAPPSKAHGPPQPPPHRIPPRTTSMEPPQLNLKLDFEPLEALRHDGSSGHAGSSSRIPIPKDAPNNLVSRRYTPNPTDDVLRSLSESISGLRAKEPTPPLEQARPKDHISELEERREKLVARRVAIRRDIWTLEQALDPTGSSPLSQTHLKRSDIKELITKKNVEVDEVEKEIFDVGMLIHRAWRRRCRNGEEGSTHLWIHNVAARTSTE